MGGTYGIDIDRDGRSIWVFERCGQNTCTGSSVAPLLKFDSSGNLVKSFGANMFVTPHGVHVDAENNVWVTDQNGEKGKGHQVFKFNQDGRVLMTLGTAGVAGDGPDTFNQPTDVAVAPNGDIFVADGHGGKSNARVVKFSKDGKFIKAWGRGSAPGDFDSLPCARPDSSRPAACRRSEQQSHPDLDQDGKFLEEWKHLVDLPGCSYATYSCLSAIISRRKRPTLASRKASESAASRTARSGSSS